MSKKPIDYIFVGLQIGLFMGYLLLPEYTWANVSVTVQYLFAFITIVGLLVLVIAILQLNTKLSPFPTPLNNSVLITNGLYHYVRHPIYTGIIVSMFGFSVYNSDYTKLLLTGTIVVLFYYKSEYEEKQLIKKFPTYPLYRNSTGRFLPKITF
tara:strand:+ start:359 stop:817 length:459 start_codon:yes stop_codon:yes gene_type:complete